MSVKSTNVILVNLIRCQASALPPEISHGLWSGSERDEAGLPNTWNINNEQGENTVGRWQRYITVWLTFSFPHQWNAKLFYTNPNLFCKGFCKSNCFCDPHSWCFCKSREYLQQWKCHICLWTMLNGVCFPWF